MKNAFGPLLLASVAVIGYSSDMMPDIGSKPRNMPINNSEIIDTNEKPGGNVSGADAQGAGTYEDPELPPDAPPGSIPEGAIDSRTGKAYVDFDGSGYHPPGDTYNPQTAHRINGQYLNGDTTKYIVVNEADYGKFPMGSQVYVYNHTTNQGTWAIAGDRGPANTGRAEMSVATCEAIGVNIDRGANGQYQNSNNQDQISYHYYPK